MQESIPGDATRFSIERVAQIRKRHSREHSFEDVSNRTATSFSGGLDKSVVTPCLGGKRKNCVDGSIGLGDATDTAYAGELF